MENDELFSPMDIQKEQVVSAHEVQSDPARLEWHEHDLVLGSGAVELLHRHVSLFEGNTALDCEVSDLARSQVVRRDPQIRGPLGNHHTANTTFTEMHLRNLLIIIPRWIQQMILHEGTRNPK